MCYKQWVQKGHWYIIWNDKKEEDDVQKAPQEKV